MNRLRPTTALLILFLPGFAYLIAALVFNPWVLRALSPDHQLLPYTEHRAAFFMCLFALMSLLNGACYLGCRKLGFGSRLARSPALTGLLFSINAFVLLLFSAEAALGVKFTPYSLKMPPTMPDVIRFFRHVPGFSVSQTHINAHGTRGAEFENQTSGNRIVFMGDSVVFGFKLEDDESIPAQLQRSLGPSREIINAGVISYGAEHYHYYTPEVLSWNPSGIILGLCLNDLTYTSEGRLDHKCQTPESVTAINKLTWSIQLYSALISFSTFLKADHPHMDDEALASLVNGSMSELLEKPVLLEKKSGVVKAYLRGMAALAKQHNIPLKVVIFPIRAQYVAGSEKDFPDHARLQEALLSVCRELGIEAIDLKSVIQSAIERDGGSPDSLFLDYIHFNAKGCRVIGEYLAGALKFPAGEASI